MTPVTEQELAAKATGLRVTEASLQALVQEAIYHRFGGTTTTACCLVLTNGFTVMGTSACADPANFNEDLGQRLAYQDAFRQLWRLEGYRLRCDLDQAAKRLAPGGA